MKHETAGDPMTGLKWTRRTTEKIAGHLQILGIVICANSVARLLRDLGYSLLVNHKKLSSGSSEARDEQFSVIAESRDHFDSRGDPIISVDTKKKEMVGNFKNPGTAYGKHAHSSTITTSAARPMALPFPMAFTMSGPIGVRSSSAPHATRQSSPSRPSRSGGVWTAASAIKSPGIFLSWLIVAAATAVAAGSGSTNSSKSPTGAACRLPSAIILPALPSGTRSNTGSSVKSAKTGPAGHWTVSPLSKTTFAPQPPHPG